MLDGYHTISAHNFIVKIFKSVMKGEQLLNLVSGKHVGCGFRSSLEFVIRLHTSSSPRMLWEHPGVPEAQELKAVSITLLRRHLPVLPRALKLRHSAKATRRRRQTGLGLTTVLPATHPPLNRATSSRDSPEGAADGDFVTAQPPVTSL